MTRESPRRATSVDIALSWDGDLVRVDRVDPPRTYCLGDGTVEGPCDFALPREILGDARAEIVRAEEGRALLLLQEDMTGTFTDCDGTTSALAERRLPGAAALRSWEVELREGASAHVDLPGGRIALDIRSCARAERGDLRATLDVSALRPLLLSATLHLVLFAALLPMTSRDSADHHVDEPDILFIRRMLEASEGRGDPGELGPTRVGAIVYETVASPLETTPSLPPPPPLDAPPLQTPRPSSHGGKTDAGTPLRPGSPSPKPTNHNPFSAGDAWVGTYTCAQGQTDLVLVIESTKGNTIHARFDFDFVPRHESGSFELTGKFDPETQGVTLAAGAWISKPGPTWKTVSMDGFVDASGREYSGLIASSGCGSFSVVK